MWTVVLCEYIDCLGERYAGRRRDEAKKEGGTGLAKREG